MSNPNTTHTQKHSEIRSISNRQFQYAWFTCRKLTMSMYEYRFTSLSAQSWQYRDRRKPEAGTIPYSYFEWLQVFFIVHSTIGSTIHSMPLNSLEHCECTTTMTNIRPDRDSNLVPPGYKPQSIRISRRGRPLTMSKTIYWLHGSDFPIVIKNSFWLIVPPYITWEMSYMKLQHAAYNNNTKHQIKNTMNEK